MKNTIISIDGCDRVGKETLAKNLSALLQLHDKTVKIISLPAYAINNAPHSPLEDMLKSGELLKLSPIERAILFANDRKEVINTFNTSAFSSEFDYIIFDRYSLSNIMYQLAVLIIDTYEIDDFKIDYNIMSNIMSDLVINKQEFRELANHIYKLEHDIFKNPIPKYSIWLNGFRHSINESGNDSYEKSLALQYIVSILNPNKLCNDLHWEYNIKRINVFDKNGSFINKEKISTEALQFIVEDLN